MRKHLFCLNILKMQDTIQQKLVEIGELDPDNIHLPGIYVDRIVVNPNPNKHIEIRTVKSAA